MISNTNYLKPTYRNKKIIHELKHKLDGFDEIIAKALKLITESIFDPYIQLMRRKIFMA